jgi:hypothetical protein
MDQNNQIVGTTTTTIIIIIMVETMRQHSHHQNVGSLRCMRHDLASRLFLFTYGCLISLCDDCFLKQ